MATVFNIQKFCINDGPGIRTTVFFKGCPLRCLWCHNPESKRAVPELLFNPEKCIGCGACTKACGHDALLQRSNCANCGNCAAVCVAGAREMAGRPMSTKEILEEVLKDKAFYDTSGGGMTVSGGEPMLQFRELLELLTAAKEKGLHICMETCGFAPAEHYQRIQPLVDLFLFDYKLTDPALHQTYTGQDNHLILSNLRMLDALGAQTVLRCPIIPTVNDTPEHFAGIAATASSLRHIQGIDIEPYHPMGSSKTQQLGLEYPLPDLGFPEEATVQEWIRAIQAQTPVPVKKG
ncbi:MAG: glycyl-radical enzyme activating protein [Clostridia bacterium]|nr:glycyl-radical enzyme activating protein [Clostridia bacterium]